MRAKKGCNKIKKDQESKKIFVVVLELCQAMVSVIDVLLGKGKE